MINYNKESTIIAMYEGKIIHKTEKKEYQYLFECGYIR